METLWQDFRFSVRTLVKSPGFTAVAVLSLALGIGANTTIFTLINAVFLNPLPVEKPSELVALFTTDESNRGQFLNALQVSFPNYEDYRDQNEVFSGLAAYSFPSPASLAGAEEPEQVFVEMATGNFFEVLGVKPAHGRFFIPEEDRTPGTHPVAVLRYGFWERRFAADPSILGRTLDLNGTHYTVVGIAPEGFKGVNAIFGPDIWVPAMMHDHVLPSQLREWFESRRALLFNVAGRLAPGVTVEEAEANVKTIARRLEQEYPEPNNGRSALLMPLTEATIFPGLRENLVLGGTVLMIVVGLVLLIACSNVANLLLAKAAARRKEIAVRLSMGAGRGRLVRQLLTESLLLGLLGGVIGLLVAFWGRDFIWAFRPPFLAQNTLDLHLDARVLAFTFGLAFLTGIVFGLVPALQGSRTDVVDVLKEETRTAGRGRRLTFRAALVVGQVALSIVSLVAAGLFLRSLQSAHRIDPGFETEKLAVMVVNPGQRGYAPERTEQFYRQVRERLEEMPGIRSASWAANLPLFGGFLRSVFIEGQESPEEQGRGILVLTNVIDLDFFATSGIELLRGRDFSTADREDSVPVAIVNQTMADRFWPDQEPIGKRFKFYGDDFYHEVVGVARTAKYGTIGEEPQSCVYLPLAQNDNEGMVLYIRAERDPAAALEIARTEIRSIDPQMPINNPSTVQEVVDQSLWAPRLGAALLTVLGILALALAAVGLYGVMAYNVAQRSHEIGLRMALGAERPHVLRMVLRQGMLMVGTGVALGLAVSYAVSRAVSSLLYGISATDAPTFLGVSAILVAVALLATLLPAYRASRVDPLLALRYE